MFRSYPGRLAGLHPQAQRDPLACAARLSRQGTRSLTAWSRAGAVHTRYVGDSEHPSASPHQPRRVPRPLSATQIRSARAEDHWRAPGQRPQLLTTRTSNAASASRPPAPA
jgi:hypothetical protein